MKPSGVGVRLFWIALGVGVATGSYRLGLGRVSSPGPGFFPFLLAVLFSVLALCSLLKGLLRRGGAEEQGAQNLALAVYARLGSVVAALFAFGFLLERLGFLLTTFLTLGVLFAAAGFRRWPNVILCSAAVVTVTYFVFTYLGVRLPAGVLPHPGTP